MTFDLQRILESKAAHRRKLADLPIGEKLRLLDEMRERALTIQHARPVGDSVVREDPRRIASTLGLPNPDGRQSPQSS